MKIQKATKLLAVGVAFMIAVSQILLNTQIIILRWRTQKLRKTRSNGELYSNFLKNRISRKAHRKVKNKNKVRSHEFWDKIVQNEFQEEDFIENFRMGKKTVNFIVEELKSELQPKENFLNKYKNPKITSVKKKVAVALYALASCAEYRVVGSVFGIHKSTVHKIIYEFTAAVNKILTPRFIQMPTDTTAIENASFFQKYAKLPNIIGAIDGTHIPILPPEKGHRDFINRKGWSSIILQGVVDHRYRFMDICVKNPGSSHDAAVLAGSELYKNIDKILPKGHVKLGDEDTVPYLLLGDPAYPLLPWLLKPYPSLNITPEKDSFNVYISSARVAVEIAFGRLKARWRRLLKRSDINYKFMPNVVAACCTLHNIVETRQDLFVTKWLEEVEKAELLIPQPKKVICRLQDSYTGTSLRDRLCQFLANRFPLRASKQAVN